MNSPTFETNIGESNDSCVTHIGVAHYKPKNNESVLTQTCSQLLTAKVKAFGKRGVSETTLPLMMVVIDLMRQVIL